MCVHTPPNSKKFNALTVAMLAKGLVPITLTDGSRNYSMFVNPSLPGCVARAYHDLRSWHPMANISGPSYDQLLRHNPKYTYSFLERRGRKHFAGRNIPDSLDLETNDFEAVYLRCEANGYITAQPDDEELLAGVKAEA